MSDYRKLLSVALILIALLYSVPGLADKTDIVILINGDAVTGEIKALEFGTIRYSTDSMGTVSIDWEDISSITSEQNLEIEVTDGSSYFGRLLKADDQFTVRVKTASQEVSLAAAEIIRITPIETSEKFYERLEGSFSFGFQTQKSSEVTTSNMAADVRYRTRDYLVGLKLNSTLTDQPAEETKVRQSIETNYQRFRANRWFTDVFTRWEKNDELGIQARSSAGWALGRYFVQTNRNQFSLALGLQGARASYLGEDDSTTEAEGRFEIRYLHRSLVPESSLTLTSKIYPLIEDLSQYRAETDISFRREFFSDFFFDVTLGYSYISDPPTDAASNDYNVTTSIGYSF
jgi:hypothetical protein